MRQLECVSRPRQATKESDPASACQSAHPTPHYDKRSLRRLQGLAAGPDCSRGGGVDSPQATKESDPASACQSAHPRRHYDERSLRRLQELAAGPDCNRAAALARALSSVWWETYAPHAGVRSVDGGQGPFHAPGSHGREWHPAFEGGSWG